MKNKILNISLLLGIALVLVMTTLVVTPGFVSAAENGTSAYTINIDQPTVATTWTTVGSINISIEGFNLVEDANYSCNVSAVSVSTANSTEALIIENYGNNTNLSVTGNATILDFDVTSIEDGADYAFTVGCFNDTDIWAAKAVGLIFTINNTVPTAATTLSPSDDTTDTDGDVTFSGTVTGTATTNCTLYFPGTNPGASSYIMTHSADSCSHSLTGLSEQTYDWYIQASDGTDIIDSSTFSVMIDSSSGTRRITPEQQEESIRELAVTQGEGGLSTGWIIAIVVIAIGVIAFVLRKRGK